MGAALRREDKQQPCRVILVGLDSAGKTTALHNLHLGEVILTIPTIGFNVEHVESPELHITCWDVGGKDKIRPLWRHYYQQCDALAFMVDLCDTRHSYPGRDAKEQLFRMLAEDDLRHAPLLIFANKTDRPDSEAMPADELADFFGLHEVRDRHWTIQPCCARTGEGLREGFNWLQDTFRQFRGQPPGPAKVVTLNAQPNEEEQLVEVRCTSVGGEELLCIQASAARLRQPLAPFRAEICERLDLPSGRVRLLLPDGKLLENSDDKLPLAKALGLEQALEAKGCTMS